MFITLAKIAQSLWSKLSLELAIKSEENYTPCHCQTQLLFLMLDYAILWIIGYMYRPIPVLCMFLMKLVCILSSAFMHYLHVSLVVLENNNWRAHFQNLINPLLVLLSKTGFFDRIYTQVYGKTKFRFKKKCICVSYLDQNSLCYY